MNALKITVLRDTFQRPKPSSHSLVITYHELRHQVLKGKIIKHLFRYREARLLTYRLEFLSKPFATAIALRLLSFKTPYFEDEQGRHSAITIHILSKFFWQLIRDSAKKPTLIRQISAEVKELYNKYASQHLVKSLNLSATPVYLRTDMVFGLSSGGSVGHIAGVLNNIENYSAKPLFLTTDVIPSVRSDLETHYISPGKAFWNLQVLPMFLFNEIIVQKSRIVLNDKKLSFIYQRYSINNYSGIKLATFYDIPFVLEYNGSEIWINRNWGKPLKYESLANHIELLNLKASDVIVVVSRPLRDELATRGIETDKILVNPNGVNTELYSPDVSGSYVRKRYNLVGKTVIGFIGTFGKWHGAEVLAEAFVRILKDFPEYREKTRLLMIGDGLTMPQVKEELGKYGQIPFSILTGIVPQEEGPNYLAACDILASPHVPNPDGSPFFGSPTKLFEYMAMGKGIIASKLDQIGEILEHNNTAWMVKPGDSESLMLGLKTLIDDKQLRDRLGQSARRVVVAQYTWKEHTSKIIQKLKERCK